MRKLWLCLVMPLSAIACRGEDPLLLTTTQPPQADAVALLASVAGTLSVEAGCVRLVGDQAPDGRAGTWTTPVFPAGYRLQGDQVLGLQNQPVAALDARFDASGGYLSEHDLRALGRVDPHLLDTCEGPYVLVNPTREEMDWPPPRNALRPNGSD